MLKSLTKKVAFAIPHISGRGNSSGLAGAIESRREAAVVNINRLRMFIAFIKINRLGQAIFIVWLVWKR